MVDEEAGVGTATAGPDALRVAELEREVRELRHAREVLETVRAYFLGQPGPGASVTALADRPRDGAQEAGAGASAAVEIRALGPLEAVVAGQPADLGAPKQRALLALLASRVGQPATAEVIVEELWDGGPPRSALASLQAYIANLRRVLEPERPPRRPATRLRTCGRGYLLDARAVQVDACRFGEHATAGWHAWRRGDSQRALREFEQGLALWRGPAYVEVAGVMSVLPEAARLEELRLSVTEGRCAALLGLGAHEIAIAELEAFTQAHPLREYGCELLSLALYRAGRQADALAILRANRGRLADELGIEPRPALQQLENRILNQAPVLDKLPRAPGRSG
jgi:DNA-binding SARP family transcriptional activator